MVTILVRWQLSQYIPSLPDVTRVPLGPRPQTSAGVGLNCKKYERLNNGQGKMLAQSAVRVGPVAQPAFLLLEEFRINF